MIFCCNCKKIVPDNHLSVTRKPVIDEHWYLTDDYPHPVKHWKEATYMGADCFEAGVKMRTHPHRGRRRSKWTQ